MLISWALHRGTVPIVKSLSPKRMEENWASYNVALSSAQMKRLDALDCDARLLRASGFCWKKDQTWQALWDGEGLGSFQAK